MATLRWLAEASKADVEVDGICRIGRGSDNDVVIDLTDVSRAHVRLECEAGVWHAVDLGSTNGTVVDCVQLRPWQPHPVGHGAVLDVGGAVRLRFLLSESERAGGPPETTRRVAQRTVRLTPAEGEVLELLFVHYDAGRAAPRLATLREMAEIRHTSAAAVKMLMQSLYDKFDLAGQDERNKEALALRAQQWNVTRTRR